MELSTPAEPLYPPKPEIPETEISPYQPFRTLLSLLLYIGVYFILFRDLKSILILVAVMVIHESGHFLAMKIFGYEDIKMFFVPLMGAFVSGKPSRISPSRKAVMILAGPVPGILLGLLCLLAYSYTHWVWLYQFAFLFLLLNLFNLLPFSPMDGGQLAETIYFRANQKIQVIFILLSCLAFTWLSLRTRNYLVLLLVAFLIIRLRSLRRITRIRKILMLENINITTTYDELSDQEYWQIRKILIREVPSLRNLNPGGPDEKEILVIDWIKLVLIRPGYENLSATNKFLLTAVWIFSLLLPLMVLYYFQPFKRFAP